MNNKGDFNIQGLLIGMAFGFGLFILVIAGTVNMLGVTYDSTGYESSDLSNYSKLNSLADTLNTQANDVEEATVNPGAFDFLSDIFSKVLAPFKFIYRSYRTLTGLSTDAVEDLELMPEFKIFFTTLIIILVIVGIVLIKFYMGRQK